MIYLFVCILLFLLTIAEAMNEEQRIAVCKASLSQIYAMLRTSPEDWRSYVTLARTIIAHLDATGFMTQANRHREHIWVVTGLQRLASINADGGGVPDIASWCAQQWLVISHRDPNNLAALQGLGEAWLARAQPALARIHRIDGSSSSRVGSAHSQRSSQSFNSTREAELSAQQLAEAERRAATTEYVEARGYLQPATDYFDRAITAATAQRAVSGELLATTAEAYMSMGNASSPRVNEQYFRRALQLLRAATQIEGYILSTYLQQYLDDYGRSVD